MAANSRRPEVRPVRVPQRPIHTARLRLLRHGGNQLRPGQVLRVSRTVDAEGLGGVSRSGGDPPSISAPLPRAASARDAPAFRRLRIAATGTTGDGIHVVADSWMGTHRRNLPRPRVRAPEEPPPRLKPRSVRPEDKRTISFTSLNPNERKIGIPQTSESPVCHAACFLVRGTPHRGCRRYERRRNQPRPSARRQRADADRVETTGGRRCDHHLRTGSRSNAQAPAPAEPEPEPEP